MTDTPPSEERYQESLVPNDDRPESMLIKDRATGKAILVIGDDRHDCLTVLRALNIADKSSDRIVA